MNSEEICRVSTASDGSRVTVCKVGVTPHARRYRSSSSKSINSGSHWLIVHATAETGRFNSLTTEKLWAKMRDFNLAPKGRLSDSLSWQRLEVTLNRPAGELFSFHSYEDYWLRKLAKGLTSATTPVFMLGCMSALLQPCEIQSIQFSKSCRMKRFIGPTLTVKLISTNGTAGEIHFLVSTEMSLVIR